MRQLKLLIALDQHFESLAEVAVASFLLHQPLAAVVAFTPIGTKLERLQRLCDLFGTPLEVKKIGTISGLQQLPEAVRPYFYCIEAIEEASGDERYLYVDSDTLCIRAIHELSTLQLTAERPFAVCSHGRPMPDRQLCLDLQSPYHYFNAGVILFDSREGLSPISTSEVVKFYLENEAICRFREQCALNYLLRHQIVFIPSQYNYLSWMRERHANTPWHDLRANTMAYTLPSVREDLAIVHFSAGALPSRVTADRLERPDHYWLKLQAALCNATTVSALPRYEESERCESTNTK